MIKRNYNIRQQLLATLATIALFAMPVSVFGQTQIKLHSNKYKVEDDVKLGRQAAAEAERQFPILNDSDVNGYVSRVGQRLVNSIPSQFQQPRFSYYFKVVNARDINAFALPGGPMYVNRGMIEAARTEGEMAGVMAHELSHVALRHGTAQASKAQKYGLLAGILGIGGAILGGPAGAAAQIAGQGVGVYFLKFSREYETEADILGAQIMARAGYDPMDLANMFRTIEQQGGGSSGGFLSSHPSPANRYARIQQEARMLRIENPMRNSADFSRVQARLRNQGRAPSMEEIARSGQRYPTGENTGNYPSNYPTSAPRGRVEYPSTRYQSVSVFGGGLRLSVPSNWRELPSGDSVWFAPDGAYGQYQGQAVFTHGVNFGVAQTQSRNFQQATNEFLQGLAQSNNMRQRTGLQRTTLGGRAGLTTSFTNINEATGQAENVTVITTQLRDGRLLYMIAVAPENEAATFQNAFRTVMRTVQING